MYSSLQYYLHLRTQSHLVDYFAMLLRFKFSLRLMLFYSLSLTAKAPTTSIRHIFHPLIIVIKPFSSYVFPQLSAKLHLFPVHLGLQNLPTLWSNQRLVPSRLFWQTVVSPGIYGPLVILAVRLILNLHLLFIKTQMEMYEVLQSTVWSVGSS